MALFKFRKGGDDRSPSPAAAPQSIEAMRKRARHRLVGSAILVLLGVVGLPLVFDNQPRPVKVDIPIEIPDKAKAPSLSGDAAVASKKAAVNTAPASAVPQAPASAAGVVQEQAPSRAVAGAIQAPPALAASVPGAKPAEVKSAEVKPVPTKPAEKFTEKTVEKAVDKAAEKTTEAAKVQALLEGKSADKVASDHGRFVVQFGAFADVKKAHEIRMKVEKAGLKTYSQVVQSAEGKKFRLRVGPFERRADAQKAADKIKTLDLPAAILEL